MNRIELIAVGSLKFPELKKIEQHYLQKINYFVKCSLTIIEDFKVKDQEQLQRKEALAIRENLKPQDYVLALDRRGEQLDSSDFSVLLARILEQPQKRAVFLIGGYSGLHPMLDESIQKKISFSRLTFPHDLFRIVFLEQLYRAFTIRRGMKYHR